MNKKFSLYSHAELVSITEEELAVAIRLEAADAGIPLPFADDAIAQKYQRMGYVLPTEYSTYYEIVDESGYSSKNTGLHYANRDQALAALNGAFSMGDDYKHKIKQPQAPSFTIIERHISHPSVIKPLIVKIETAVDDNSRFIDLQIHCHKIVGEALQDSYEKEVRARRWQDYLALANGDEKIARAFWDKQGNGAVPVTATAACLPEDDVCF